MGIQYFIVAIIVIVVVIWQYKTYKQNEERIKNIKKLFPSNNTTSIIIDEKGTTTLHDDSATKAFRSTLNDINSYLQHNKNKTFDYHILKEIVNRNAQSLEDEVDTMLSVPLYLGLIATIFGIAFGVIAFAWKDLADLLAGTNMNPAGIKILLTDVGIAMIASLAGVWFTKQSTTHYNSARTEMVRYKNRFLTWIQTDLMSKLSDDISGALIKMAQDLNEFNRTFANNTRELKNTLDTVKKNYDSQIQLLEAIDKIKINRIAKANIDVYDRLQGCTQELENLFTILANSEMYVAKVIELNTKLDSIEERTHLFEELGNYFKNEIDYVRDRQGMMRQEMSSIDSVLQEALSNLGENLAGSIANLTEKFQQQNQRIQLLIEEQQNALALSLEEQQSAVNEKINQIENPFAGLKEIFEEGIKDLKTAFTTQNEAIKTALESQRITLEESLAAQQKAIIQKLQETPGQLQSIAELSKVLDKLNNTLKNSNLAALQETALQHDGTHHPENEKSSIFSIIKKNFVQICACGSFISLLILLILKLLEL